MADNNTITQEDKVVAPTILAPRTATTDRSLTTSEINAAVGEIYTYAVESKDPLYARFLPYPNFLRGIIRRFVETGSIPTDWEQWDMGKAYGVPPEVFRKGLGAGGGVNTANAIRSYETAILNRSSQLGMTLDPQTISYIARVAEAQDYSQEQLMAAIGGLIDFKQVKAGTLTASLDEMRTMAKSYLLNVSDATLQDYAKKLALGQQTKEGIDSYFKAQAKAMNPWLAQYIDSGIEPIEVLRSSRDFIANSLGVDANAVDFTQSRFLKMATVTDDKGQTRLANNQELVKNIRSDSEWAGSMEARKTTSEMANMIARIFGRSSF